MAWLIRSNPLLLFVVAAAAAAAVVFVLVAASLAATLWVESSEEDTALGVVWGTADLVLIMVYFTTP